MATATVAPRVAELIAADKEVKKAQAFVDKAFALAVPLAVIDELIGAWEAVPYNLQSYARSSLRPDGQGSDDID